MGGGAFGNSVPGTKNKAVRDYPVKHVLLLDAYKGANLITESTISYGLNDETKEAGWRKSHFNDETLTNARVAGLHNQINTARINRAIQSKQVRSNNLSERKIA